MCVRVPPSPERPARPVRVRVPALTLFAAAQHAPDTLPPQKGPPMTKTRIAEWSALTDRRPTHALVANVDLVVVRYDDDVSVLYGRCLHRGALMADGEVRGDDIICGVHNWDYEFRSGVSSYDSSKVLHKFSAWVEDGGVWVDADEIVAWERGNPQVFDRNAYQGAYQDSAGTPDEPHVKFIKHLASHGLSKVGHHGPVAAMGVPRGKWDDLQFVTAQLARVPQLDDEPVGTELVIGPEAAKPLHARDPAVRLRHELRRAVFRVQGGARQGRRARRHRHLLRRGRHAARGAGGQQPLLLRARLGALRLLLDKLDRVQAFHFKGGQGAKTGTGGHLPGDQGARARSPRCAELEAGQPAISPARFPEWEDEDGFRATSPTRCARQPAASRSASSSRRSTSRTTSTRRCGIGVDYIILDGRGGGTGAAPLLSSRQHLGADDPGAGARPATPRRERRAEVTLIITGGLRTPADFAKAMALGADGVAVSNAALQAIGCLGMRACHTNNCPVGIATQKEHLRDRLPVDEAAERLARFFAAVGRVDAGPRPGVRSHPLQSEFEQT